LYKGNDNQNILTLIQDAKRYALLSKPLTKEQVTCRKYFITNLFEDATDILATDKMTTLYILDKIVIDMIDFIFSFNQQPLSRIKDRIKTVLELDPSTGYLISKYYSEKTIDQKYELTKQMVLGLTGATGFF
jgi:hypothetical protein